MAALPVLLWAAAVVLLLCPTAVRSVEVSRSTVDSPQVKVRQNFCETSVVVCISPTDQYQHTSHC